MNPSRKRRPSPPPPPTAAAASAASAAPPTRLALAALALVVLTGLLALYRSGERDFWFHLAAGRSIAAHGLPDAEVWCLAARGQWPWLGEWLFHAALYAVRSLGGDAGVALWRAAWAAAALALCLWIVRGHGALSWAAVLLAPLVLAIVRGRQTARPEQVSLALVLLFIAVFERARRSGRDATPWLVGAQVIWANLHPGWVFGPVLAWLYAACELLPARDPAARRRAWRWAALGVALVAASAITPRPLDTLTLRMVRDVQADPARSLIWELRSWSWAVDRASPFTAWLALAGAAAVLAGGRAWRASPPLALAAAGALAAGALSLRFRALGVMVSFPWLALALEARGPRARLGLALAAAAGVAGAGWLAADARKYVPGVGPRWVSVPVRAVALADSLGLQGPVLNTSWYGGYILWVRGESHPPLVDTRNLGSAEFRSRMARANGDPAALDSLIAEWRFTHAILEPPASPADRLAVELSHRPGWSLIFADDAGLLFVQRDRYPELAAARGYRLLTPDYPAMSALGTRAVGDSALARALGAELERARAESPWHARASLWLGALALARGKAAEAVGLFDEVERLAPITPGLALRQGYARQMTGDPGGARAAFRRALREPDDAEAARQALKTLR